MPKKISQLLLILSASVIGGFILAFILIKYYDSKGQHLASQLLISPDIIEKITFQGSHPQTHERTSYIFDHNEFVYFDYLRGKWVQKELSLIEYAKFYQLIALDKNIETPTQPVFELFQKSTPTALITSVRTEIMPTAKVFQAVQFTKEDFYRIKIQDEENESKWIYFYHYELYHHLMNLFKVNE